jgi:CubicO group peptidase (beta-lactamase class C family)
MTDGLTARLQGLAATAQRHNRLPSLVLATARRGAGLGTATIGQTAYPASTPQGEAPDEQAPTQVGLGTPYRVGSITKTFTAALVLLLAERKMLRLDAPVRTYLPDDVPFGHVPLRMLLAHHAGLPREVPVDMWASMQGPTSAELRAALRQVDTIDGPGARWHYSNFGYAVLGQAIEHRTGTSCAELIDTELLAPLRLSHTTWTHPVGAAVGYRVDPYADVLHPEPDMDQAAAGVAGQLWSTASDLLHWGDALTGGAPHVLPDTVVEAMHTPQVMVDRIGWTRGWGLGLILDRRGDRIFAGHTGAMPGYCAALSTERNSRTVTVALTTATRSSVIGALATDITELALSTSPPADIPAWRPAGPCPAELDGVLGPWWSESAETVVTWRADGLHSHLADNPAGSDTRLIREHTDAYRAVGGWLQGERLYIRRDLAGRVSGLEWATYPYTRSPR